MLLIKSIANLSPQLEANIFFEENHIKSLEKLPSVCKHARSSGTLPANKEANIGLLVICFISALI